MELENSYLDFFDNADSEANSASSITKYSSMGAALGSAVPVLGTVAGAIGGAIVGLAVSFDYRGASSHNQDHRNHVMDLWDKGQYKQAIDYLQSYITGVGWDLGNHMNNLDSLYKTATRSISEASRSGMDADHTKAIQTTTDFNNYYKSFLDGVASPLSAEVIYAYIKTYTTADFRFLTTADIPGLIETTYVAPPSKLVAPSPSTNKLVAPSPSTNKPVAPSPSTNETVTPAPAKIAGLTSTNLYLIGGVALALIIYFATKK